MLPFKGREPPTAGAELDLLSWSSQSPVWGFWEVWQCRYLSFVGLCFFLCILVLFPLYFVGLCLCSCVCASWFILKIPLCLPLHIVSMFCYNFHPLALCFCPRHSFTLCVKNLRFLEKLWKLSLMWRGINRGRTWPKSPWFLASFSALCCGLTGLLVFLDLLVFTVLECPYVWIPA